MGGKIQNAYEFTTLALKSIMAYIFYVFRYLSSVSVNFVSPLIRGHEKKANINKTKK